MSSTTAQDIDGLKPVEKDVELDQKESDIEPVDKEEDVNQVDKKENYVSQEQQEEFLKQFESVLKTAFPETYANFSFKKDSTSFFSSL